MHTLSLSPALGPPLSLIGLKVDGVDDTSLELVPVWVLLLVLMRVPVLSASGNCAHMLVV